MDSVDATDTQIIRYLQDNARASYADVARQLGVSESTAKRRIENLIDLEFIVIAVIPEIYKLGYGAPAFVGLMVDLSEIDRIASELCSLTETTLVASTMGRFDMVLFVAGSSLEQLSRFLIEKVSTIRGVRSVETMVAPKLYKQRHDWRLPIDELLVSEQRAEDNGEQLSVSGVPSRPKAD